MRIKKALTSEHVLIASDGSRLTVADLVKLRPRDNAFQPNRSGSYSVVQATYPACVATGGGAIPAFKGEVEARVQNEMLRIAGRLRQGLGWKDGRVKLPLADIAHARVRGSQVDLGLRGGAAGMRRLTLELFTPNAAGEFVHWLPNAGPWPAADIAAAPQSKAAHPFVWGAVIGTAVAVGLVLVFVLTRP
jgi:hypothetical protein